MGTPITHDGSMIDLAVNHDNRPGDWLLVRATLFAALSPVQKKNRGGPKRDVPAYIWFGFLRFLFAAHQLDDEQQEQQQRGHDGQHDEPLGKDRHEGVTQEGEARHDEGVGQLR